MSKKLYNPNNVRILIENVRGYSGFFISLDISGQKEYLLHHNNGGLLFQFLKDGMTLGELYRYKPAWSRSSSEYRRKRDNRRNSKLLSKVEYLIKTVDEYLRMRAGVPLVEKKGKKRIYTSCHAHAEVETHAA